jgi:fatty acid desaturase
MQNKRLMGQTYEWDTWCTADNWRYSHNYRHHTYTNVLGEDHDIGYGVLRLFPEQKWEPRFLANVPMMALLATFFENLLALQTLELEKVISGEKTLMFSSHCWLALSSCRCWLVTFWPTSFAITGPSRLFSVVTSRLILKCSTSRLWMVNRKHIGTCAS